ncbi:hypothetical protein ABLE94_21840 [Gordonia sp. VNK1]|uniref:hypothetical protein n=1 Tax=Gordonia oleivorans TaxID=3156618 RepID=UPI0032B3515A
MTEPTAAAPPTSAVHARSDAGPASRAAVIAPILALSSHLRGQWRLFIGVVAVVWTVLILGILSSVLSVAAAAALVADTGAAPMLLIGLIATVIGIGLASWTEQWFAHVLAYRVIDTIRLRIHPELVKGFESSVG